MRVLCLLILLLGSLSARAISFTGGSITYSLVMDSTYRFTVKLFTPCDSPTATVPSSFSLCYYNSCSSSTGNISMQKQSVGTQPGAPYFTEYEYTGVFTLPSRCDFWTFYVSAPLRHTSVNLLNPLGNIYLEATLNNDDAQGFNSPDFGLAPVAAVYRNAPFSYNTGIQPNGDSTFIEIIQPRTATENLFTAANCSAGAASLVPYGFGFSNMMPFPSSAPFIISQVNGTIGFTPNTSGYYSLVLRVSKYKNGIKIGSVMREEQLRVVDSIKSTVAVGAVSGINIVNMGPGAADTLVAVTARAYAGTPIQADITGLQPANTAAGVWISSDQSTSLPGSAFTVAGAGTNTATGSLSFSPTTADTGSYRIVFAITDSVNKSCLSPESYEFTRYAVLYLRIDDPTSVSAVRPDGVKVFPNPAADRITVQAPVNVHADLLDTQGRKLRKGDNIYPIDMQDLSNGVYYLRITDSHGRFIKTEKLIRLK